MPVISPSFAVFLSKILGFLNRKVAVPVLPSRDRVKRTSGYTFSSSPFIN